MSRDVKHDPFSFPQSCPCSLLLLVELETGKSRSLCKLREFCQWCLQKGKTSSLSSKIHSVTCNVYLWRCVPHTCYSHVYIDELILQNVHGLTCSVVGLGTETPLQIGTKLKWNSFNVACLRAHLKFSYRKRRNSILVYFGIDTRIRNWSNSNVAQSSSVVCVWMKVN